MKHLIIHGDPGIRKDAIIEVGGDRYVCFSINRQGEWHGPSEVQLWCTVGGEDELDRFERREFVPMHLDVEAVDASDVTVVKAKGDLAV